MSTVVFRRPQRRRPPEQPSGEVVLEAPPEVTEATGGGVSSALIYLPMAAGGAAMAFLFIGPGAKPITVIAGIMYGVAMVGMMIGQMTRGASEKKRQLDAERRDYARYLTQLRRRIRRTAARQRQGLLWHSPAPESLWSLAMSSRLWERRPSDNDFGAVRVGTGVQRLAVGLTAPETKPIEDLEPVSVGALRRFLRTHGTVPDLPVSVLLQTFARVLLRGEPEPCRALVRAMVTHLAVLHSPDDLMIAVCAGPGQLPEWDWVKWLPHALHPTEVDGAGPARLFASRMRDLETLLPGITDRPRFTGEITGGGPQVVVVVDGLGPQPDAVLANTDLEGVTIIDLSAAVPRDPEAGALQLQVTKTSLTRITKDNTGVEVCHPIGMPDRMAQTSAEQVARLMAPLRTSIGSDGDDALSRDLGLPQLLGLGDAANLDVATTWRPRPLRDRLRVPLGVGPGGNPVELDIKEAAQDGMGPHGLVVGATGSGKSELLRTLVLGLATTHPTDMLNFVLVDFKGGATFARLEDLPHTSAVITNLEDDLSMVDRMRDSLDGELNRRQELLRQAGNYANLKDYEAARQAGEALAPLPTLFIVVDEFSELLTAKPDFIDLFITIGRIGRSLGVHLLLASQRLEEGRLRGLDTYLSYRIGLRTFSSLESRVVLGVPDAYSLPNAPGHGYLKIDTSTMLRFRAAYVSGPHSGPVARHSGPIPLHHVVPYGLPYVAPAVPDVAPTPAPVPADPTNETVLEVMVSRLMGRGAPAHPVWLPPLGEPPTFADLLPPLVVDPRRGLTPRGWPATGRLVVPVGLVDKPYHQRRDPLLLDLSGAGGHVAVVGAPQSGKSTVLRDIVAGLAMTHTPEEVQFYCIDLGGGSLVSLAGLPHVGSVAGRLSPDVIRRTMAEITSLLGHRERIFAQYGLDSMTAYRQARRDGTVDPDDVGDPFGDVFLVVDGWGTLRTEFEALEPEITAIAARGLGYGIHVVISSLRWMEVRPALRDLVATRIELRLGDPSESEIDRRSAVNVPQSAPGRGITREKLHFLSALPRLDGDSDPTTLAAGVADLVQKISAAWTGRHAPRVRLLPELLPAADLPTELPEWAAQLPHDGRPLIPLGVDEAALRTVYLDTAAEPHLVIFGDTGSGKSNVLRLICHGLSQRYAAGEAKLALLDYRHSLLDIASLPHTMAHGFSSKHASPIITNVIAGLQKRLPPSDITPDRLRRRDWWSGPEVFIVIDDYDLVSSAQPNPMVPLLELVPLAREIGLHVIIARSSGGAGRSMFDPVLQRIRETGAPAFVMSGSRDEGVLFGGVRPEPMPPGRGQLTGRRGLRLVQSAYLPPPPETDQAPGQQAAPSSEPRA